jgi:F-type H+-transporting ATPase subunit alpha
MKFKTDEIASVIREEIARYRKEMDVAQVGRVLEVGDGIAQIFGLSGAMAGEMLEFENGAVGQVFNLEESSIGAVIFGDYQQIREGDSVRATGRLLEVPVGPEMLGRVVDPLGRPLDGGGPIAAATNRPVEVSAPGIAQRQPVTEPLHTGVKAVDAMTPIGRGQRELIIGDRKTGKTALAVDTIISQNDTGVICVYVAIGQKESTVAGVVETLRARDALKHTIIVSASSSDPAPLQYIAPYAGCTMAEHFMYSGKPTLIVYDDLSKQAAAYRQISLLLRRPPGREAYPGDIFYLHSRLLERAAKLADRYVIAAADTPSGTPGVEGVDGRQYFGDAGRDRAKAALDARDDKGSLVVHRQGDSGGSMTALPICETQEGEVSSYIPTNLIGITDGQIYLEPSLFFAGVRPAINVGISVSRVGYKAAQPAMKTVAKSLRLDLAAYRELESFAQLGMELDRASQRQLDRGKRMVQLLIQPQYTPLSVIEQVIQIFSGTSGFLDDLSVEEVLPFAAGAVDYLRSEHRDFYDELASDLQLDRQRQKRLRFLIDEYKDGPYIKQRKARRQGKVDGEAEQPAAAPEAQAPPAAAGPDVSWSE